MCHLLKLVVVFALSHFNFVFVESSDHQIDLEVQDEVKLDRSYKILNGKKLEGGIKTF